MFLTVASRIFYLCFALCTLLQLKSCLCLNSEQLSPLQFSLDWATRSLRHWSLWKWAEGVLCYNEVCKRVAEGGNKHGQQQRNRGAIFRRAGGEQQENRQRKRPIQPASHANVGQSATLGTPAPLLTETQTQIANRTFRQQAAKIADAEMTVYAGENEWEPLFLIVLPELRSEAARRIYKLRSDLYRKYPEANLNVEVRGRRERGAGREDAPFLIS